MSRRDDRGSEPESLGSGKCTRETMMALLFDRSGPDPLDEEDSVWIPKSVVHDDSEVHGRGMEGEMVVKRWWAESEGLL